MNNIQLCERFSAAHDSAGELSDPICAPFPARYSAYRSPLHFQTKDTNSYCESFQVANGLVVLVMNVGIEKPVEVQLRGQDIIEFHYRLTGSLHMEGRWGTLRMHKPSMLLWYQPEGCDDVNEVIGDNARRETSISLYCDFRWLAAQSPEHTPWLSEVMSCSTSESERTPAYRIYSPCCQILDTLEEIIRNPFRPELRSLRVLYTRGKALELLCQTFLALRRENSGPLGKTYLRERDRRYVNHVREILTQEFAAPPRIDDLARRVGMSSTKLRVAFRKESGQRIADFVRTLRLNRARELLMSPDMQVGQAALAVGYKHHSTFTAAFTKHFGTAPESCRSALLRQQQE